MYKIFISFALILNFALAFCSTLPPIDINRINRQFPAPNLELEESEKKYQDFNIAKRKLQYVFNIELQSLNEKAEVVEKIEQFLIELDNYNIILNFKNQIYEGFKAYFKDRLAMARSEQNITNAITHNNTIAKLEEVAKRNGHLRRGSFNHSQFLSDELKNPERVTSHTRRGSDPLLQSALINKAAAQAAAAQQQEYKKLKPLLDRSLVRRPSKDIQNAEELAKLAQQQAEQERIAREKAQQEKIEKEKRDKVELEALRNEQAKAEQERITALKKARAEEQARITQARLQAEYEAKKLIEQQRKVKIEQDRRDQEERIKLEQERAFQEHVAREKARAQEKERVERERNAFDKADIEAFTKRIKDKDERERKEFFKKQDANDLAARQAREKARQQARAKEEHERQAKLDKEKKEQEERDKARKRGTAEVVIEDETPPEESRSSKQKANISDMNSFFGNANETINDNVNQHTTADGQDTAPKPNVSNDDQQMRLKEQQDLAEKIKASQEQEQNKQKTEVINGSNYIKGFLGVFCAFLIYNFFDKPSKKNKDDKDNKDDENKPQNKPEESQEEVY